MKTCYYANTKQQRLDQHLFAVGFLASEIVKRQVPNEENLAKSVFLSGIWHDVGKIDPAFQNWLSKKLKKKENEDVPEDGQHIEGSSKFSFDKHPRHNEISLLFFHLFFNSGEINEESMRRAEHAIFWHHTKPYRKNEIQKLVDIFTLLKLCEENYSEWTSSINKILSDVKQIAVDYTNDQFFSLIDNLEIPEFEIIEDSLEQIDLPNYKQYSFKDSVKKYQNNIQHNALNNLARSALITADRLVSKMTGSVLEDHLNNKSLETVIDEAFFKDNGLKQNIQQCLDGFNHNNPEKERNLSQSQAAKN